MVVEGLSAGGVGLDQTLAEGDLVFLEPGPRHPTMAQLRSQQWMSPAAPTHDLAAELTVLPARHHWLPPLTASTSTTRPAADSRDTFHIAPPRP